MCPLVHVVRLSLDVTITFVWRLLPQQRLGACSFLPLRDFAKKCKLLRNFFFHWCRRVGWANNGRWRLLIGYLSAYTRSSRPTLAAGAAGLDGVATRIGRRPEQIW